MRLFAGSLLLGLAAATFYFSPVAEQLVRLTPIRLYFIRTAPDRTDYATLFGLILIVGLFAGATFWASYSRHGVVARALETPLVFLCVMGITHFIDLHLSRYPPLWNAGTRLAGRLGLTGITGWFLIALAGGLVVVAGFIRWPRLWMLAKPVLCGGAAVVWFSCGMAMVRPPAALPAAELSGPRLTPTRAMGPGNPVVWIILDEWDYDLTFRRQDQKVFPEFDRLRQQSVFLENVRAAGKVTLVAIPGLLMGRQLRDYRASGASTGRFVAVGATEAFPGPRTIFDNAPQFGYQSHVVGWYHPYCRMFAAQLTSCWWDDLALSSLRPGAPVVDRAAAFLRETVELEFLPGGGPANNIKRQLGRVDPMIEQAAGAASHPGRSLSFLHLPLPHSPFFRRDPGSGAMEPLASNAQGYQAGLDAADGALGTLRQAMERAGVWNEALVIVSSDHPYRYQFAGGYGNGHIPMLIKFPHQTSPLTYTPAFQAAETKNLIEDFMQGNIATPEHAVAWLEKTAPPARARATAARLVASPR